jgi:hypoxanthine phosphoribosyltransferase
MLSSAISGYGSSMLQDVERILFHEQTIHSRLDEMAREITEAYRGQELTVIAVLNGSLIFAADLLRRIPLPLKLDCVDVASYHGGTESSGVVTFNQIRLPDIDGRHVLVIDDILDSGRTLHAICARLRTEAQPASVRVCVLLSKCIARAKDLEADFVGFEIGGEFVVGYGLDYQEHYRNLPFVGVLKRSVFDTSPVSSDPIPATS